ncbi:MAG: GTP-binding protein, partial [Oscillospiraceae bacterium]
DDKPLKYPLMFSICSALIINKIDVLPYFDFDLDACEERVRKLNPNIKIIRMSAKTGEGIDEWTDWLRSQAKAWNESI